MLGVYPVGTLLTLDTGEIGLALHDDNKADQARPQVQLLSQDADRAYTKGKLVDLAEHNPDTGKFLRNIIKTEHPATHGIQPASFLI